MARKKKRKLTKGERTLYFFGVFCFVGMVVLRIFFSAGIGNYQMGIEKMRFEINREQRSVQSLSMQVNELTSFYNVRTVVKEMGLAYNNDNIIIIND